MSQQNACAYLDIVGFGKFIEKDIEGALRLLTSYHARLASYHAKDDLRNFDYFLPFSDSIFIQSSKPDIFVAGLSSFLSDTFFTYNYKPRDYNTPNAHDDPAKVVVTDIIASIASGKKVTIPEYWFPLLIQGGISFGECHPIPVNAIINNKVCSIPNLVGKAVVEAVKQTDKIKGPRLICSQSFYAALSDKHERRIIKINDTYEILWPAFNFTDGNKVDDVLINQFNSLLLVAVNLWKDYKHLDSDIRIHYYESLKLIVRSALHYFSSNDKDLQAANDYIFRELEQVGLSLEIINDLMK